jgi:hypothetical protein
MLRFVSRRMRSDSVQTEPRADHDGLPSARLTGTSETSWRQSASANQRATALWVFAAGALILPSCLQSFRGSAWLEACGAWAPAVVVAYWAAGAVVVLGVALAKVCCCQRRHATAAASLTLALIALKLSLGEVVALPGSYVAGFVGSLLIFMVLVHMTLRKPQHNGCFAWLLSVACAACCGSSLLQLQPRSTGSLHAVSRLSGIYGTPNELGFVAFLGVSLGAWLLIEGRLVRRSRRLSLLTAAAALTIIFPCGVCLLASGCRGAWVAAAATLGATVALRRRQQFVDQGLDARLMKGVAAVLVLLLLGGTVVYTGVWHRVSGAVARGDDSISNRLDTWLPAIRMLLDHKNGVGVEGVLPIFEAHYKHPMMPDGRAVLCNDWLVSGLSFGPAVMLFLAGVFLFWPALAIASEFRRREAGSKFSHFKCLRASAVLLGASICCMFNPILFHLPTAPLYWATAAWWVTAIDSHTGQERDGAPALG